MYGAVSACDFSLDGQLVIQILLRVTAPDIIDARLVIGP